MKKRSARYKLSAFSPVLFLGIVACADVQNQDVQTAVRPVSSTSALAPEDDVAYQGAVRAINDRDYGRALDYLQAARSIQHNDVRVLNAFGVVYDKLGRFDLSARYYGEALAIEPQSPIVQRNIAYSGRLQGMQDGQQESTMVATLRPAPVAPTATADLAPLPKPIAAQDEIAPSSQSSPIRIPLRVKANPPPIPTSFSATVQSPDLGPLVTAADWATTAPALSKRTRAMVSPSLSPVTPVGFWRNQARLAHRSNRINARNLAANSQRRNTTSVACCGQSQLWEFARRSGDTPSRDFKSLYPTKLGHRFGRHSATADRRGVDRKVPVSSSSREPSKNRPQLDCYRCHRQKWRVQAAAPIPFAARLDCALEDGRSKRTKVRQASSDSFVAHVPVKIAPVSAHLSSCVNHCSGIELFVAGNYWGWNRETNAAVR